MIAGAALRGPAAAALPDRRAALAGVIRCAGGAALVLAGVEGGISNAAPIADDDPRVRTATVRQTVAPQRTLGLYLALPAGKRGRHPAVMIVHDERGLDEQARAVARQVALEGYVACAPDFLSRAGGTPIDGAAALAMTAALDPAQAVADAVATMQWLGRNPPGERVLTGKVGSVGLGWGGGIVGRIAIEDEGLLTAGVIYGGRVAKIVDAARSRPPLLLHLGCGDTDERALAASRATGGPVQAYADGCDEALPGQNTPAAALAWQRTSMFLKRFLA